MIISRALFREAALTSAAIIVILLVLMLFVGLTQALGQAVTGKRAAVVVFQLMGLELTRAIDTLLPLALFLGVLLTISRWYRDSEMTVLAACGISLMQVLRPVMALAIVFFVLVAISSLVLSPWAARQIEMVKGMGAERVAVEGVQPKKFNESKTGNQVLYVEAFDREKKGYENVFLSQPPDPARQSSSPGVVFAASGRQLVNKTNGQKYLVLQNGTYYEGRPGAADYRIVTFDKYTLHMQPLPNNDGSNSIEAVPTSELVSGDRRHLAEFHWRLARPVAVLVLVVFALVLAYTDARRGRSGNVFVAILVFFIYINLLGIGVGLLKRGAVSMEMGLWWVHGGFVLLSGYLLRRRLLNKPLFALPGWGRS